MFRLSTIPFPLLASALLSAQDMGFFGGTLTVDPGTTMTLIGPIDWEIMPGAVVVNHGIIDLGPEAGLIEQAGAPITGLGTERAVWPVPAAITNAEPGNLGLTISTPYAAGDLVVVRGHQPAVAVTAVEGIARWYQVTMPGGAMNMAAELWYDQTELNGIDPAMLALFEAPLYVGPWTALASISDIGMQTVSATDQAPVAFLSAFDLDAANALAGADGIGVIRAWPTAFHDRINVVNGAGIAIRDVELIDADGRMVWRYAPAYSSEIVTLFPPELPAGLYLLRVNGTSTLRLIRI